MNKTFSQLLLSAMSQQKIGKVWNFSRNLKLLYFLPLSLLLLERLWLPFASIGSSSYLDVETTAVTRKQKDVNARSAAELPMLAQLTASATDWIMCPGKTEVITNKINEPDSSSSSKRQIPMVGQNTISPPVDYFRLILALLFYLVRRSFIKRLKAGASRLRFMKAPQNGSYKALNIIFMMTRQSIVY